MILHFYYEPSNMLTPTHLHVTNLDFPKDTIGQRLKNWP